MQALPEFTWSDALTLAARDHCSDMGKTGKLGHMGADGSSYFDRIARYGEAGWYRGENLSYSQTTGESVVM